MTNITEEILNDISRDNVVFRTDKGVVIERQMAHDPQYKVGSRIPGRGKVTEIIGRGRA